MNFIWYIYTTNTTPICTIFTHMFKHLLFTVTACWIFSACKSDNKIQQTLKTLETQTINVNLKGMQCLYQGIDTIITDCSILKLRLIKYIDSSECSPCILDHMYYWNDLLEDIKVYNREIQYTFIVAPKTEDLENTYLSIKYGGLNNPIYVDTAYTFKKTTQ